MRNLFITLTFFFYATVFGQIELKIVELKKDSLKNEKLVIEIRNLTNNYLAVPFDQKGFKGYNSEELCSDLKILDYPHRFFGLALIFKDKNESKEPIQSLVRSYHVNDKDVVIDKVGLEESKTKDNLTNWGKNNKLKSQTEIERNFYIMHNLLLLEPKEKIRMNFDLDIFDIKRGETSFYNYYILNNNEEYSLSLKLCADKFIYNYLTVKQKQELKKYKFFSGMIESNTVPYLFSYE
ncbi:hypothetical protein [Chryseobacterium sp. 2987]|uniref:hypothetical protein n=1 Tax=Chryseobacterium sp. 2987 TaxID=2817767 RepID=UPI0028594A56|nr:hypothetical protein [Chryseobacterium sp. 2987]MDR6922270.1 hypothetical protein [Chryseobacterium sp. 2987]